MSGLFITATGTGIGKTVLTAGLAYQLRRRGENVRALKPVISGYDPSDADSDTAQLLRAQGLDADRADAVSPWRFKAALSPDMAARREGRPIDPEALVAWCRAAIGRDGLTLIEGVGGAFAPLEGGFLVADWMAALDIAFLLVTGSHLGTISHSLAAIEALAARGLSPAALVLSQSADEPVPIAETAATLARLSGLPITLLPRLAGPEPWRRLPDLAGLFASTGGRN